MKIMDKGEEIVGVTLLAGPGKITPTGNDQKSHAASGVGEVWFSDEYSEATPENKECLFAVFWSRHHRNLRLDC